MKTKMDKLLKEIEFDLKRAKERQAQLRKNIENIHLLSRRRIRWINEVAISHFVLILAGMILIRSVPLFLAYCACVLFSNWYLLNYTIDKVGKF